MVRVFSTGTTMSQVSAKQPLRVGLISLGCAKNLVDAEIMLGTLLKDGVQITNDAAQADVLIVNTCSFIDSAQEESVDTILESNEVREAQNRGQALVVAGCLPQRFREDLPRLVPEVEAFMGIDQVGSVTEIVRRALARRAARLAEHPKSKARASEPGTRKASLMDRLGALDKANGAAEHDGGGVGVPPGTGASPPRGAARSGVQGLAEENCADETSPPLTSPLMEVTPRPLYIPDYATPRFRLTPRHFAYVKIAEGCNHPCSFCTIPRMRGTHRSRPQVDVLEEARRLVAEGVKELNLISQDSTYYGVDLRPHHSRAVSSPEKFAAAVQGLSAQGTTICTLLRGLEAVPGDFWVRLLYTHPAHWTAELIETIAACSKAARYVDIPLQHVHENMLERMRRETSRQYIVDLLARIRAGIPGIALRTTFIVGFPGESEAHFETLLAFIRTARFERLGVFTYSQEEGTRAGKMAGQIPDKVKRQRRELAMAVQHEVAVGVAQSFVGKVLRVLIEGEASAKELASAKIQSWEHGLIRGPDLKQGRLKGRYLVARSQADAPDIDGRVYVRGRLTPGEFAWVKVIGHTDYDLIAEPV
ncbi:Ribosomal protein S12 methylthiotransferase RimO [Verrucomicrobia bacterium]|nr:Ribosomal protein S12 methylthiotransferase RimO [Verrucomicrobiota bacterium]